MSNLRTAAQQALEALEMAKLNGKAGLYPAEVEEIADAITDLRAALAEPVQEPDPTYKRIGCVQHDCEECQRRTQRKLLVDPAEYDDAGAAERYNRGLK